MVQVPITDGILEGEVLNSDYGGTYYSFKGIPYAEPPLGDMRFKAPIPKKPWQGIRKAKEHGPICIQAHADILPEPIGSEDCLYLNVYTPDLKPTHPLPVMVFIHGGGFLFGSGNDDLYDAEFLIKHGVILVTFNYRLEVLGFLCLDTEDIPGNAGMKDQVAAMKWVNNNIKEFGGDPDNVTIFGISAGGVSAAYHLVSPMSKGLFKRAILQSGTNTCYWAQSFTPREKALNLARNLGCQSEDDKEIYEFFKSLPPESLVNISCAPATYLEAYKVYWKLNFSVVSEKQFGNNKQFFSGDIYDVIKENIDSGVELIVGCLKNEGIMNFVLGIDNIIRQANKFREYFVPTHLAFNCSLVKQVDIGKKIRNRYFKNKIISTDDIDSLIHYCSMDTFVYGIIEWAKIYAKSSKNRVFVYTMSCETERNIMIDIMGLRDEIKDKKRICHSDDMYYLFGVKLHLPKVDEESETFKLIQTITTLWTNFAKYGNPTPDGSVGVRWKQFTVESQEYLDIGNEIKQATGPYKEDIDFWEDIFKEN